MTPYDFDYIRKLLKQRSGLTLSAEKQYLVESRLMPLAPFRARLQRGTFEATVRAGHAEAVVSLPVLVVA